MLTIARLKLRGWKCYREETVLDFEAKPYAVFAQKDGNRDASNWGGKSSLLEAVDFALYGRLIDEFKSRKRGWISRGEKSGEVDLTLSDGSRVVRSQQLSGSERLWYFPPGAPDKGAVQDAAQQRIEELVGLSKGDFAATRYFRQGEMARLVVLDPGPRLDLVAGWLRLGALQDCEGDASEVLRDVARRRDAAAAEARAAEEAEAAALLGAGAKDRDGLECAIAQGDEALGDVAADLEAARAALEGDRERAAVRAAAEAYERVVEEGKRLAAEHAAGPGTREALEAELAVANDALSSAAQRQGRAAADGDRLRVVAQGRFDGTCPLAGEACPARSFVEGHAKEARERLAAVEGAERARAGADAEASRRQRAAAEALHAHDRRVERLQGLREEARRLKPSHERWRALSGATGDPRGDYERARADHQRHVELLARMRAAADAAKAARERAEKARAEAERLGRAVRVASTAKAVFGATQRRLAEDSLAEIEGLANDSLGACGVGLSMSVRWSREGSGVAKTCASCGEPFPRSERAKTCERCGADRGQNVINALTIETSARSGGALDLAGIFLQLSAGGWLVEDRGSQWGCALLDEPLAALDAHHRRAVAAHLPRVLRECGVEQSLIIGHDRAALDALPARIVIESRGGWSTARVQA